MSTMTDTPPAASKLSVTKEVRVRAPRDVAWEVFTRQIGQWWPLETHKLQSAAAVDLVIEPEVGGAFYERGEDGSTCTWGRVLNWSPHDKLVVTWQISPDWKPAPEIHTEIEVRFFALSSEETRVELEHRFLESYGGAAEQMRQLFDSPMGWPPLLDAFAARAAQP